MSERQPPGSDAGLSAGLAPAPQKMAWERRYSDDSGVQYAVRYDATRPNSDDGGPTVEIEAIDTVRLPLGQLDWLLACLQRIRAEVGANDEAHRNERSEVPVERLVGRED